MTAKKRVLPILVALLMVFAMMPIMGSPAYAASGDPAINLVEAGNAPNIAGAQASSVWFGNYKQSSNGSGFINEPVKWRVLKNADGKLFLLSDQNLDVMKYNENPETGYMAYVTWEECTMRAWLNGTGTYKNDSFIGDAFSGGEQSAVLTTTLNNEDNSEYLTPGGNETEDKLFLLSIDEAKSTDYGFTADSEATDTRVATNTAYAANGGRINSTELSGADEANHWWLRSPGYDSDRAAGIYADGRIVTSGPYVNYDKYAVRPAFNLSLEPVIFTSAAEGGKSSGIVGADSLIQVGTNANDEWKMTVKSDHDSFAVSTVSMSCKNELSVGYSGAITGKTEYISAIIKDKDGKVKSYGNLKNCAEEKDDSGTVMINADGKLGTEDTLYIFNEQLNGEKMTDFASELKEITIPQASHKWDAGTVTKKATTAAKGEKTYTCTICKATKKEDIPKLAKKANPLKVKGKTATVKYSKLKKKTQTLAVTKVIKFTKKTNDKKTYTLSSAKKGKKNFKKYFKVSKTTGKVTIKKNKKMKKGTYKVKVKVKALGNANYEASAVKTVAFTVKVK